MSETPKSEEKKGWFARLRSRGAQPGETLKPAGGEVETEAETLSPPISESGPVSETLETRKEEVEAEDVEKKGWLSRLRNGLAKSTKRVTESITGLFTKKKLD